jgi:DNA-binding response OmpR family regulator
MNGVEVLKAISKSHSILPVIMLTGTGDEKVAVKGLRK